MLGILCLLSCRKYLWKLRTITTWEFGGVRRVCANRAFWLVTYRWCRCYCQQCSMEHVRTSAFETTVFFDLVRVNFKHNFLFERKTWALAGDEIGLGPFFSWRFIQREMVVYHGKKSVAKPTINYSKLHFD